MPVNVFEKRGINTELARPGEIEQGQQQRRLPQHRGTQFHRDGQRLAIDGEILVDGDGSHRTIRCQSERRRQRSTNRIKATCSPIVCR